MSYRSSSARVFDADSVWTSTPISGERVIDEWAIVDRWWTAEPVRRRYRVVEGSSGERYEMDDGAGWKECSPGGLSQ